MRILLIVYDNGSWIHFFPIGTAYIASVLRKEGYDVEIYNQDVHHYTEKHLTDYLNNNRFDAIGLGVTAGYYQYKKLLKISQAINRSKTRPDYYILGGHGPSPEPGYFLNKTGVDVAVIGEGEETIVELVNAISNNKPLSRIKGIAYRNAGQIVINDRRPVIQDIDDIPWPAYDMFPIEHYRLLKDPHSTNKDFFMPVLSARGCSFRCNFCYRMDEGYRARDPGEIVEEIKFLNKNYSINYIEFADELLMSSKSRTIELCEEIIKSNLRFKWFCSGRLNYATVDVLKMMKNAGCVFINYGIESFDDNSLRNMNKSLTTKQIVGGIEATLRAGISPGYNMIFGNIGETKETLDKSVGFLLRYDNGVELRTIRPVTPYPGSSLYYYAIEKGLLKGVEDFYENKHVNSDLLSVNFTDMSNDEFHRCLMEANVTLLKNYYKNKLDEMINVTEKLYLNCDANFRGYRQI